MPSCWPPVAWPSLPCSTSCSDPARRIRKTTPDVRRSPCRWASFFVPPDYRGRCGPCEPCRSPAAQQADSARRLLLMEKQLSPDEKKAAIAVMEQARFGMTGQNKVWLAGNVLTRALLQDDKALAKQARDSIVSEIVTGQAEGLPRPRRPGLGRGKNSPLSRARQSGPHGPRYGAVPPLPTLDRPCRRAEGKQAGRTPDSGQKKTTGCPGGGAAGQRGRMF